MRVTVGVFCVGLAVGIGATWLLLYDGSRHGSNTPVRDLEAARTISVELAEQHREKRYEDLDSLLQILELPSRFSQREALYALAGRSSSGELQGLVFDANRIANDDDRDDALRIVFSRLTELDPLSALTLSRDAIFEYETEIETHVWQVWARSDFENALFEAKTQTSAEQQNLAAQALFSAYGLYGDETVDRIRDELGIEPDQANKTAFVLRLADRSPVEAIEYINNVASMRDQTVLINALAAHLSRKDPELIAELASRFNGFGNQQMFRMTATQQAIAADPAPILERLLNNGRAGLSETEIMGAVMSIAEKDLDAAMRYFEESALGTRHRQMLGSSIAQVLARKDVDKAIEWAKSNNTDQMGSALSQVLRQVAMTDPQRAVDEALAASANSTRSHLLGQVLGAVASRNPQVALGYLDQLPVGQQKDEAAQNIMMQWMRRDSSAAVDWLQSTDAETASRILSSSGQMIVYQDIEAAQRLLPLVPPQHQDTWRQQIAHNLVASASSQEALEFVEQFKDSKNYQELKGQAISAIAQRDPDTAEQLARDLPSGRAKDQAFASVIASKAHHDPGMAIAMLSEISDERSRGQAAGTVGRTWYQRDPASANAWINELPAGQTRDRAVLTMASAWVESNATTRRMVASISDSKLRGRAKLTQVQRLMQTDRAAAEELLEDPDIPERNREQLREWMASPQMRPY